MSAALTMSWHALGNTAPPRAQAGLPSSAQWQAAVLFPESVKASAALQLAGCTEGAEGHTCKPGWDRACNCSQVRARA